MKSCLLLMALLAIPALAPAETIDLGTHGKFSITVPKDWIYAAQKMEDTGYTLTFTAPGTANANLILTLVYVDSGEPSSKDKVQADVLGACDQFVEASVEKKKVLQEFSVPGAYGVYCVFTDASMVGKPVTKNQFKMVALGEVRLDDDLSMSISMLFDEAKGPDFQAMMDAISSASVSKAK